MHCVNQCEHLFFFSHPASNSNSNLHYKMNKRPVAIEKKIRALKRTKSTDKQNNQQKKKQENPKRDFFCEQKKNEMKIAKHRRPLHLAAAAVKTVAKMIFIRFFPALWKSVASQWCAMMYLFINGSFFPAHRKTETKKNNSEKNASMDGVNTQSKAREKKRKKKHITPHMAPPLITNSLSHTDIHMITDS